MRLIFYIRLFLPCLLLWPAPDAVAEEPLAVIVAPGHLKELKKEDLILIFKRKKLFWSDGSRVQPVNLPASNPSRRAFSLAVLGVNPEDLEKYWNDMYFNGISPPFVLLSDHAVMHFVADTPGAIGYVPYCKVDTHVEILLLISTSGHVSDDLSSVVCPK
ncbi:MAG: hypothetical protein P4L77_09740 [Sulfuriferula sp.]|nr:hypothetical protein [Sulfuriferula sp.]